MRKLAFISLCLAAMFSSCAPKAPAPSVNDLDGKYILMMDGKKITDLEQWKVRRQQIFDHFADHIYGRMPEGEVNVAYEELSSEEAFDGKAVMKTVNLVFTRDTVKRIVPMWVFLPAKELSEGKKVPVFLGWPDPQLLTEAGYAAINVFGGIYPDGKYDAARNKQGESLLALWGIRTDADCQPNTGQMFACQAWTFSRIADYIESLPEVFDSSKIGIAGCSRGGKCAAWAAAADERFSLVAVSQSGAGGLGLTHYEAAGAEPISNFANMFPHWFCPDFYANYSSAEKHTEYDQDALAALIAPRPLYDCVSYEYAWGNPTGEFLGVRNASEVYALYGYEGLNVMYPPTINTPIMNRVGFHVRLGGHSMSRDYDWPRILEFAAKWWN